MWCSYHSDIPTGRFFRVFGKGQRQYALGVLGERGVRFVEEREEMVVREGRVLEKKNVRGY
jgi:hypothetical protein